MRNTPEQATVTRTYRAAIRSGDDYITIEETIVLPPTASDADIAQAVDTGLRMFKAQHAAVEAQIASLNLAPRSQHKAPATSKQQNFIGDLCAKLGITIESAVQACGFTWDGLTADQASTIIDALKAGTLGQDISPETVIMASDDLDLSPEPEPEPEVVVSRPVAPEAVATDAQKNAISGICKRNKVTVQHKIDQYVGKTSTLATLTKAQAGKLIQALQKEFPSRIERSE